MKTTTEEFHRFLNEGWPTPPDDWYLDDNDEKLWEATFHENDNYRPIDRSQIIESKDFDCAVCYQGNDRSLNTKTYSLEALFKKWKKIQTTMTLVISFPKEQEKAITDLLKKAGVEIKKN